MSFPFMQSHVLLLLLIDFVVQLSLLHITTPRDRTLPAQPISIRKAKSRKNPQTFAHLVNVSKLCQPCLIMAMTQLDTLKSDYPQINAFGKANRMEKLGQEMQISKRCFTRCPNRQSTLLLMQHFVIK